MENTSKETKPIPRRDRAFYRRNFQHRIHSGIAAFFAEEAAAGRITKKQLADLLEKNPAQITRWLSEPSNIESDTISDILLGMQAQMETRVVRFSDVGKGNQVHHLIARIEKKIGRVQFDLPPPLPTTPFQKLAKPETKSTTKIVSLEPA